MAELASIGITRGTILVASLGGTTLEKARRARERPPPHSIPLPRPSIPVCASETHIGIAAGAVSYSGRRMNVMGTTVASVPGVVRRRRH
jgi:hypothetical protein